MKTKRISGLVASACVFAAVISSGASAAPQTTQPGSHVFVAVQISKKQISIWDNAVEPRGFTVTFHVVNKDTRPHSFALLGKTTGPLVPGASAQITVYLGRRGRFPYGSTVNPSARLKGFFTVV